MKIILLNLIYLLLSSCGTEGISPDPKTPKINSEDTEEKSEDSNPDLDNNPNDQPTKKKSNKLYRLNFKDPGIASVGDDLKIIIEVLDSDNKPADEFNGEIQVITGGSATRTGKIEIINGSASVVIQDEVAEEITLTLVSATQDNLDASDTLEINFIHDPAKFIKIGETEETKAGIITDVAITVEDQYGNIAKNFFGETTLQTDGAANVKETISIAKGIGNARIQDSVAELVNLSLVDSGNTSLDITSTSTWQVVPNAPFKFVILPISDTKILTPLDVIVEVQDSLGNFIDNYNKNVTLSASGSVSGEGLVDIVGGTGSLTVMDNLVEDVVFILNDTENTGLNVSSFKAMAFLPTN